MIMMIINRICFSITTATIFTIILCLIYSYNKYRKCINLTHRLQEYARANLNDTNSDVFNVIPPTGNNSIRTLTYDEFVDFIKDEKINLLYNKKEKILINSIEDTIISKNVICVNDTLIEPASWGDYAKIETNINKLVEIIYPEENINSHLITVQKDSATLFNKFVKLKEFSFIKDVIAFISYPYIDGMESFARINKDNEIFIYMGQGSIPNELEIMIYATYFWFIHEGTIFNSIENARHCVGKKLKEIIRELSKDGSFKTSSFEIHLNDNYIERILYTITDSNDEEFNKFDNLLANKYTSGTYRLWNNYDFYSKMSLTHFNRNTVESINFIKEYIDK